MLLVVDYGEQLFDMGNWCMLVDVVVEVEDMWLVGEGIEDVCCLMVDFWFVSFDQQWIEIVLYWYVFGQCFCGLEWIDCFVEIYCIDFGFVGIGGQFFVCVFGKIDYWQFGEVCFKLGYDCCIWCDYLVFEF